MRRLAARLALAAALLPAPLLAQSAADSAAVRRAALDYVEGFYEGDSTKLVRALRRGFAKYGYARAASAATYRGMAMSWDEAMAYARSVREGRRTTPAGAPKEVTLYEVQDQTASAKVRAFWGTDYLLLAREDGRWVITHVLWQSPPRTAVSRR